MVEKDIRFKRTLIRFQKNIQANTQYSKIISLYSDGGSGYIGSCLRKALSGYGVRSTIISRMLVPDRLSWVFSWCYIMIPFSQRLNLLILSYIARTRLARYTKGHISCDKCCGAKCIWFYPETDSWFQTKCLEQPSKNHRNVS